MVSTSSDQTPLDRLRLFRNPWLERLTVISTGAFCALWAVLLPGTAIAGIMTAPTLWAVPLVIAGLLVWTLAEYGLHRHVFHFDPRSKVLQQAVFVIHTNHHAHPNDLLRNLMPPIVSIPIGGVIWAVSIWAMGAQGTWFFFGFVTGYVAYDLVHFACHQLPMKGRLARALKAHHMHHHHLKVGGNYAITGVIWDRIFATRISSASER